MFKKYFINQYSLYPHKFYSYELALDDNNNPIGNGQWVEKGEINERYTSNGLPKKFTLAGGWDPEFYEWETNGLIKKRTYADFVWQYAYHPGTRLLASITDIDGQSVNFDYDPLMRLKETLARNGNVKTTYDYQYGNPQQWQGGNKITTLTEYSDFDDQTTIQYFDGLGRPLDTWRMGYGPQKQHIVAEKLFYDNQGRVEKKSFMPDTKNGLVYSTFDYEKSPLGRLLTETFPDGSNLHMAYGSEGNYYKSIVTDENGNTTTSLTDILGRKTEVRGELGTITSFVYDNKNNLIKVVNPLDQEYRYAYDARNRLVQKTVPGAHCQDFSYDDRDLLVASRDGNLYQDGNRWVVNEYDIYGRVLRTGFGSPTSGGTGFAPCGDLLPSGLQFAVNDDLILNTYDVQGSGSCGAAYDPIGKLGITAARVLNSDGSLGGMLATKLCYDIYGRAERTESDLFGASGPDVYTSTYDMADNLLNTARDYDNGTINIEEIFKYDHGGRLLGQSHLVEGLSAPSLGHVPITSLGYNTKDQLTEKTLGGLAGLSYQYNVRGWMTHINHMPFDGEVTPMAACETPTPGPPSTDDTKRKCGECGDEQWNIEQILKQRFKKKLNVDCYIPCDCDNRCTPSLVEPCGDYDNEGGETAGNPATGFPTWLYEIRKCSGTDDHVLENNLSFYPETYAVKSRVQLEGQQQQFKVGTPEGDVVVDLPGLLGLIGEGENINIKTGKKETCLECTPDPPACTEQEKTAQAASLSALAANLVQDLSGLHLPTNLLRVRLCDGREIYLFEEEIPFLTGSFSVLQVIGIHDSAQRLVIGSEGGGEAGIYVSYYLQIRDLQPGWVINRYRPCGDNECSELDQRHYARSVGAGTAFSAHDVAAPYQDLTHVSPNSDHSLALDGQNWSVDLATPLGEAEWDISVHLPPDAELQSYTATVFIPDMRVNTARFGLHDGNGFVKVNGGLDFVTVDGQSFPQMPFLRLVPDQFPTAAQVEAMKVAICVESKYIAIDAVYVELDLTGPCDRCAQEAPTCTPQEQAAQQASLDTIKSRAALLPASDIPLPTNLYRVGLCNGDETYLLHHELELLQGPYIILQVVTVGSASQTFKTGLPTTVPEPYTGPPPYRSDLFALRLMYGQNDPGVAGLGTGYHNGNIAAMHWQVAGRDRQAYSFQYDKLDRLKNAHYAEITKVGLYYNKGHYYEGLITYDKIGNILTLRRNGAFAGCEENGQHLLQFGMIDNLAYTYNSDRSHLLAVADNAGGAGAPKGVKAPQNSYAYDNNGNLTADDGKNIAIYYNHLNLPRHIHKPQTGGDEGGDIDWHYDATGRKLKKTSPDGYFLYHDGIEVTASGIFAYHADGRAGRYEPDPNGEPPTEPIPWVYEYTMRDHLGNTRISFADLNGDGYIQASDTDWSAQPIPVGYTEILQENHYYPFGMGMEGPWREPVVAGLVNRYQYNGKELNSDLGLGWNDYGARWYDAAVGRWNGVDPLSEMTPNQSPYNYVFNNPVAFIDPTGMMGVGADGLTNDQWVETSRQGSTASVADFQKENQQRKIGRGNVLISLNSSEEPLDVTDFEKGNNLWDHVQSDNLYEILPLLVIYMKLFSLKNLNNVVIRSHGTTGGIKFSPHSSITSTILQNYINETGIIGSNTRRNIESFVDLSKLIKNKDGNLVLMNCKAGGKNGMELVELVHSLIFSNNSNFNLWLNTNNSYQNPFGEGGIRILWGLPLSNPDGYRGVNSQWLLLQNHAILRKNLDLILNKSGNLPISTTN